MSNDWSSVLIPMIRNAMPEIIAQDIVSVQPMTSPAVGSMFTMNWESGPIKLVSNNDYTTQRPYHVRVTGGTLSNREAKHYEMSRWCGEMFGPFVDSQTEVVNSPLNARWFYNEQTFKFRDEKDRTLFLLTWS